MMLHLFTCVSSFLMLPWCTTVKGGFASLVFFSTVTQRHWSSFDMQLFKIIIFAQQHYMVAGLCKLPSLWTNISFCFSQFPGMCKSVWETKGPSRKNGATCNTKCCVFISTQRALSLRPMQRQHERRKHAHQVLADMSNLHLCRVRQLM